MSTESLPNSKTSSRTASTRCVDSDTPHSASNSCNSLLETVGSHGVTNYVKKCTDVECPIESRCKMGQKLRSNLGRKSVCCNTVGQCVWGVILLILSISSFVFTPLDFMLWEKLHMRPGFPPFDWWRDPPDEVRLRAYVFNVTNHERWLAGLDDKLDMQEIGPVVYLMHGPKWPGPLKGLRGGMGPTRRGPFENFNMMRDTHDGYHPRVHYMIYPEMVPAVCKEYWRAALWLVLGYGVEHCMNGEKLLHSNVTFNENSTLTYTAKRFPIYLPEENHVDLNATLYVPNLAVLGIASFLHNAPFFVQSGFRFLVNSHGSPLFVKKTVYEYLWDYNDPVLDISKSLAPGLVPVNNMGMLARIYADFVDQITVFMGPQWGHEHFFQIHRFRGNPQIPGYNPDQCPDRILGSTEGVMYGQRLTKQDVLLYWRKTVCKLMPLYFDSELVLDHVPVYRYNLSEVVFDRITNGTDCYDTEHTLPAGISDASKCYYDFPMVISYPHFYTGQPPKDHYVTGLQPDKNKHGSYVVVEPLTGTPFRSVARMQSNLRIHNLAGFSAEYNKFSNLVLPLFWAEYNQEGLPSHIRLTIYFMVVILPPLSSAIMALVLLCGCYLITKQVYIHKLKSDSLSAALMFKKKKVNTLARNKLFTYEKESFLRKPS